MRDGIAVDQRSTPTAHIIGGIWREPQRIWRWSRSRWPDRILPARNRADALFALLSRVILTPLRKRPRISHCKCVEGVILPDQ